MNTPTGEMQPQSHFYWYEPTNPDRLRHIASTVDGHHEIYAGNFARNFTLFTESPLDGVPHNEDESILASSPDLIVEYLRVFDIAHARSDSRSRLADRNKMIETAAENVGAHPETAQQTIHNLSLLADDNPETEIVENDRIHRFSREILDLVYDRGYDMFSATVDAEEVVQEPIAGLRRRYLEYRKQDEVDKQRSTRMEARALLRDPQAIDRQKETCRWMQATQTLSESGLVAQTAYQEGLDQAVDYILGHETQPMPTAEGMERWVRKWAEGDSTAEKVIRKLIHEARSPSAITNLLYDISVAGFSTGDTKTMSRTSDLISWGTNLMPVDSEAGVNKLFARFDTDPEIRQKANELIDVAISYLMVVDRMRQLPYIQNFIAIHHDQRYIKFIAGKLVNEPDLMRDLGLDPAHILRSGVVGRTIAVAQILRYSAKFVRQLPKQGLSTAFSTRGTEVGPLGEWFRDYYATFSTNWRAQVPMPGSRSVMANLNLPGYPSTELSATTAAKASNQVHEMLVMSSFSGDISQKTFWNTLGYLVPEQLDRQEWQRLMVENRRLRDDMIVDKKHSLSPLGDRLTVFNPMLMHLGFHNIDYYMDPQQKDRTLVTLHVGNARFRCYLDRDYQMREMGSGHNLGLGHSAPFLEFILLSHLYQIHMTQPSQRKKRRGDGDGPAPLSDQTTTVDARRAHRRVLQEGESPREKQIRMALEVYGIDLVRQNMLRRTRNETRLITWVSEVNLATLTSRDPVVTLGDQASEMLRSVLDQSHFQDKS